MINLTEKIIKFETTGPDSFTNEELIEFFQQMVDNGLDLKKKKGKYADIANRLVAEGKITSEPRPQAIQFIMDLFD